VSIKFSLNTDKVKVIKDSIRFYSFNHIDTKSAYDLKNNERLKEQVLYSFLFQNAFIKTESFDYTENDLDFEKADAVKILKFYERKDYPYSILVGKVIKNIGGFDEIIDYAKKKGLLFEEDGKLVPTMHLFKFCIDNGITGNLEGTLMVSNHGLIS